jgi:hypothetical protein
MAPAGKPVSPEEISVNGVPSRTEGASRWFAAARVDIGVLFLKPRVQLGRGKPHWSWYGIEVNPLMDDKRVGGYLGVRLAWPVIDFRIGGRYEFPFYRSFLRVQESYDHLDIKDRSGPQASYLSLEAQLTGELPIGPGKLRFELTGTAILGVPDDHYVYEETLKVVAKAPWVYGGELGYLFVLGPLRRLETGPVVELVMIPGRSAWILRGGAKVTLKLWPNWEARATFQPALASPDALGLKGGDSFQLGVRYHWATE